LISFIPPLGDQTGISAVSIPRASSEAQSSSLASDGASLPPTAAAGSVVFLLDGAGLKIAGDLHCSWVAAAARDAVA